SELPAHGVPVRECDGGLVPRLLIRRRGGQHQLHHLLEPERLGLVQDRRTPDHLIQRQAIERAGELVFVGEADGGLLLIRGYKADAKQRGQNDGNPGFHGPFRGLAFGIGRDRSNAVTPPRSSVRSPSKGWRARMTSSANVHDVTFKLPNPCSRSEKAGSGSSVAGWSPVLKKTVETSGSGSSTGDSWKSLLNTNTGPSGVRRMASSRPPQRSARRPM